MAACNTIMNTANYHDQAGNRINSAEPTRKFLSLASQVNSILRILSISLNQEATIRETLEACTKKSMKCGVHPHTKMEAAGLYYTGNGEEARCERCGLVIKEWPLDKDPFTLHMEMQPTCPYVKEILPNETVLKTRKLNLPILDFEVNCQENPTKRLKVRDNQEDSSNTLVEVNLLKQMRKRTYSHWSHRASPSSAQMIEAGFFNCNVGDRVICLYCKIVCQQWTPNNDDPWEIHKTISPKCPYVVATLKQRETGSIRILNEQQTIGSSVEAMNTDQFRSNEVVFTAACHSAYVEIPRRHASFSTWVPENLPSVEDLVRAGFFYSGTKTIVTCFYCNGSLQNWGANDNPMIEHARWFPQCAYAKQLCGSELYRKIQESKRAQQERQRQETSNRAGTANGDLPVGRGKLNIPDESTLSRYVAARLDLPISQNMLDRNFKLSVIKRCWEDQLRLKQDDFSDFCDLFLACIILQKQIECIDGKKENIIIPSVRINAIREQELAAASAPVQAATAPTSVPNSIGNSDAQTSGPSNVVNKDEKHPPPITASTAETNRATGEIKTKEPEKNISDDSSSSNLCVLCLEEQKRLACIPCGHLATCVPCGHSLRSCPICRRAIDAFVRIYV